MLLWMLALAPFTVTGERMYSVVPLVMWAFYNVLFIVAPKQASNALPRFAKFRLSFKMTIEDFFSPKLLPVLSVCFLLVVLSLAVTGHHLGGPPLCYRSCGVCLAQWSSSVPLTRDQLLMHYGGYGGGGGSVVAGSAAGVSSIVV